MWYIKATLFPLIVAHFVTAMINTEHNVKQKSFIGLSWKSRRFDPKNLCYPSDCLISDVKTISMLGGLAPTEQSAYPIRFSSVLGHDERRNDVIYCHPAVRSEKQSTVVFFGGDMQVI